MDSTVAAWWLRDLSKEELLKRLTAHEQSFALLLQAEEPKAEYLPLLNGLPELSAADAEDARRIHGVDTTLGTRHWTGKSIKRMSHERLLHPGDT
ncbi:hypothetical protein [Nocardioides sp. S5]|uniref:hypothetical protein n=1 Tax=Nocardioides sp. S5 TaxID=2017486 RepID=UPI001A8C8684|nr:hypothetical protein [Nocardioides sp. S5]